MLVQLLKIEKEGSLSLARYAAAVSRIKDQSNMMVCIGMETAQLAEWAEQHGVAWVANYFQKQAELAADEAVATDNWEESSSFFQVHADDGSPVLQS